MREILDHCGAIPVQDVPQGTVLLAEGATTGRAYVLVQGRIEVLRGDTQVSVSDDPGSFYGEMSVLLDLPHTATVRTVTDSKVHVIEDAQAFLRDHPSLSWLVAKLLAGRLNAATSYLADLMRQYAGYGDHLEMVSDVLASLLHEQRREIKRGSARDPGGL
jgi:CRP/FNR family transcriptional regulator, cyclic AMP receptor protein